jgi:hypothetical protein
LSFFKLLLAFAPWIAFLIIAHGSLFRLKLGLVIALALCVVMGVTRLHRGVILWAGLCFFMFATIAVVMFENVWTVQHMSVLASGTLAVFAAASLMVGKPFTLDYAREHTDPALWNRPEFLRTNFVITLVWTLSFTANAILAWGKMVGFLLSELVYEALSYTLLVGTAIFTIWYPGRISRIRHAPEESQP